ncbi:UvrD-helicase domain-containing protein [Neobacillus sp. CF12]|uniref:UvrD-helicase domain-containing protein n=1 Tax=Neobacillus sp. CF12 TaxID=3055864 RepID=UPI0025A00145|nr:UvrD-helicase domain-containing protein [Neobacillus sp. CF12]MDM5326842.1 UvrD-helicase domain-containing protein [Neobacillus sp. CF12]
MTVMKPELEQHYKKSEQAFQLLQRAWTGFTEEDNLAEKTSRFLKNIELSNEQSVVAKNSSTDLMIKGVAGSGKSITLLARMMQKMAEEFNKRFLFVSFNHELVRDAEKRFKESEYYQELLQQEHTVHFFTFHELAHYQLRSIGVKLPKFITSHKKLSREEDNILAKMFLLILKLDSEEFKDYPPISTIKKTQNTNFLFEEFSWMKGNGFISKEDYLECERVGRGKLPNISKRQRETIYRLYEEYRKLQEQNFYNRIDREDYALLLIENFHRIIGTAKYDHIFVDEMQDLQPMQLKVLVFLNKGTMTLSGDERQRIFKASPFSYRSLGINVQGSSVILKTNHRSTFQIMKLANSLQFERTAEDSKYDNEKYFPRQGQSPMIRGFKSVEKMLDEIIKIIQQRYAEHPDGTFVIIHRFNKEQETINVHTYLGRGFRVNRQTSYTGTGSHSGPKVFLLEAKETKGLEFDFVFIVNFNNKTYPHIDEIEALYKRRQHIKQDIAEDLKTLQDKEKRILYVSLTRAKQEVYLFYPYRNNAEEVISPFVHDFNLKDYITKLPK